VIEAALLKSGVAISFETGLGAYIAIEDLSRDQLHLGRNVVVDAVNAVEPAREMWRNLARESGARLFFVEVVCSDREEHRRRVESRAAQTPPLPRPTWSEVVEREYLPWSDPILTVDSVALVDENVERVVRYLST
jgi:predicted kinase